MHCTDSHCHCSVPYHHACTQHHYCCCQTYFRSKPSEPRQTQVSAANAVTVHTTLLPLLRALSCLVLHSFPCFSSLHTFRMLPPLSKWPASPLTACIALISSFHNHKCFLLFHDPVISFSKGYSKPTVSCTSHLIS